MADIAIVIRLKDRLTARCQKLGMAADGPCGNHRFDVIAIFPADHQFSPIERTHFGIIIVTKVPDASLDLIREKALESTIILQEEFVGDPEPTRVKDRPRIIQVPLDLLSAAFKRDLTDNFDPTVEITDLPSIMWNKFKSALRSKLTNDVPDWGV